MAINNNNQRTRCVRSCECATFKTALRLLGWSRWGTVDAEGCAAGLCTRNRKRQHPSEGSRGGGTLTETAGTWGTLET
jgi:hypothetical protein